jgi:two-component system sensor histidine kinase MprB
VTLRRRLVLLAGGTVGVTVVLAAVLCYLAMRAELRDQVDGALLEQAPFVQRVAARTGGVVPTDVQLPLPPGESAATIQVLGPGGRVLTRGGAPVVVPVTGADVRAARSGAGEARLSDREAAGERVRVLTIPLSGGGAVQLVRSLESTDATLARLRLVLVVLALAGTAFALVVSRVAARRVIAPVAEITEAAEHITATEDLSRRIAASGQDEVGRMARGFNAMLDALQASRAQLADSVAAQRQVVADASHELRTPVTSLRTNIEVLLDGGPLAPEERRRLLVDVREQSEELSLLIGDVIELARGDVPIAAPEDVRLDEVVAEELDRARRHVPGVAFTARLEPTLVVGAPDRLARAVRNLLDNAGRHSPPGGTVEVTLADGELAVRDHGAGVPDADKPHVFDRFYRGASARGRPGSGLGLAMVRQAALAHGGDVTVQDAEGGGAVFRLRVPGATPPGAAAGSAARTSAARS